MRSAKTGARRPKNGVRGAACGMRRTESEDDARWMRQALRLARRAYGLTSPNPLVGALIVRQGVVLGRGWHRQAGQPHAEIEALNDARRQGHAVRGATLYVTLEPCSTHGRTPPCTDALLSAGVRRVVVGATDPNPRHAGRAFRLLRKTGVIVDPGVLATDCTRLNEPFNHWITRGTPFVTVKAALTLDGKIATPSGESRWITGERARAHAMRLRQGADAVLVGVNTILADDPSLTVRSPKAEGSGQKAEDRRRKTAKPIRRIVLDSRARTPLTAKVVSDGHAALTTIVVTRRAAARRVAALRRQARVLVAPDRKGRADLRWLLRRLGKEGVTSLLVEGGGEVNASFLLDRLAQRVAFFYAPMILGGCDSRKAVAGSGARSLSEIVTLREIEWRKFGNDLFLTARVG